MYMCIHVYGIFDIQLHNVSCMRVCTMHVVIFLRMTLSTQNDCKWLPTIAKADCGRARRLESEPFSGIWQKIELGTQHMLHPRLLKQPDMESEQEALGTFKETFG